MLSNLRYVSFFESRHGKLVPMTIENEMVNGTDGTDSPRQVGTSRCPACRIRGRPSGPSLPGCCFGCRLRLPWSAAVLCRFEDGIHRLVKCVWPISAGSKAVEDYRSPRRYRDPWHPAAAISGTSDGPASRAAGFSRIWVQGVAPGCSLLRLVAATGKKLERHL